MTPDAAAQVFVETVLGDVLRDVSDLSERHETSYRAVEEAVRKQQSVPLPDLDRLEQAVRDVAPDEGGSALAATLNRLVDAQSDEVAVKQQTAYLIGVAVGRALNRSVARKVGDR